jgi:hypothetical protein
LHSPGQPAITPPTYRIRRPFSVMESFGRSDRDRRTAMKHCLVLLCVAGLLVGCASRYDIKTTTGSDFTNVSKPKLIPGTRMYRFTDVTGKEYYLPEVRVREISIR